MSIGSLIVKLQLQTGEFETDTKRAAKIAEKRAKEIDEAFRKVGVSIGVAIGAAVAVVSAGIKNVIDEADKLNDMRIRFDIDAASLASLRYTASQTGTDIESLGKGMQKMAKLMLSESQGAKTAFDTLGISVTDSTGRMKNSMDMLSEVATKIKAIDDPTKQLQMSMEVFGKSGGEFVELMKAGGDGIAQFHSRFVELTGVMSAADWGILSDRADGFNDSLADLKEAANALFAKVAMELLPELTALSEQLIDFMTEADNAETIVALLEGTLNLLSETVAGLTTAVLTVTDAFSGSASQADQLSGRMTFMEKVASSLRSIFEVLGHTIAGVFNDAMALANFIRGNWNIFTLDFKEAKESYGKMADYRSKAAANSAGISHAMRPFAVEEQERSQRLVAEMWERGNPGTARANRASRNVGGGGGGGRAKPSPAPRKSGGGGIDRAAQEAERARQMLEREINETRKAMADWAHEQEYFGDEIAGAWEKSVQKTAEQVAELRKLGADAKFIAEYEAAALKQRQFEKTQAQTRQQQPNWDLVKSMEDERNALYLTNEQIAINNNLARLNEHATDAQKNAVIDLTKELVHLTEMRQLADSFGNSMMSAFDSIIDGSKSASQAFGDMLQDMSKMIMRFMAQKAVEAFVNHIFGALFGGNTGTVGSVKSIFGGMFGGARAAGGPVTGGKTYLVGEKGPELFRPSSSGAIVPNHAMAGSMSGGMNLKVVINNNNNSEVSQQITTGSDGMRQLEIFIDSRVRKTVGGDIASGEGLGKMFKQMGVAPQGVR